MECYHLGNGLRTNRTEIIDLEVVHQTMDVGSVYPFLQVSTALVHAQPVRVGFVGRGRDRRIFLQHLLTLPEAPMW